METNYGKFAQLVQGVNLIIETKDITSDTINDYQHQLCNLFIDYIENPNLQNSKVEFHFDNGMVCRLSASYALINLIVWEFIVKTDHKIEPCHVFFRKEGITNSYIKQYIDKFPVAYTRKLIEEGKDDNKNLMPLLNKTIYDGLHALTFVNNFEWFFNNTINNEDFILMYYNCPGFKEIMDRHNTNYYSQFPPDQVNQESMNDMNKLIEYIIDAKKYIGRDHCLSDTFRAQVGIKPKQAREMYVNIGIKPNGEGGIFPYVADTSYISGGANNVTYHLLESLIARIAQIMSKKNTARSGAFSRLMNLNCSTTRKYTKPGTDVIDPSYDCCTRNFVKYYVDDEKALYKIADRYYVLDPRGLEYKTSNVQSVKKDNADLIGKYIYLRSPITCESAARGLGICKRCMGEMYNIIVPSTFGIYSVTTLTEPLTQMMLSAKHLLEAQIQEVLLYNEEQDVTQYVYIEEGSIYLNQSGFNKPNDWQVILNGIEDTTVMSLDDEDDEDDFDSIEDVVKYVDSFNLHNTITGETIRVRTTENDSLYLTEWLNNYLESKQIFEDADYSDIMIPVSTVLASNYPLFNIGLHNDDMSERLEAVIKVINLKSNIDSYEGIEDFLRIFSKKLDDINLSYIMSLHLEVIIMNQIRDKNNILEMPDWTIPNNHNYQILPMKKALNTHPSIAISAQSENIARTLYSPLSFKKTMPSAYDLLYQVQPQIYTKSEPTDYNA